MKTLVVKFKESDVNRIGVRAMKGEIRLKIHDGAFMPEPLIQASMSRYETLNLIKALTNALDNFTI